MQVDLALLLLPAQRKNNDDPPLHLHNFYTEQRGAKETQWSSTEVIGPLLMSKWTQCSAYGFDCTFNDTMGIEKLIVNKDKCTLPKPILFLNNFNKKENTKQTSKHKTKVLHKLEFGNKWLNYLVSFFFFLITFYLIYSISVLINFMSLWLLSI